MARIRKGIIAALALIVIVAGGLFLLSPPPLPAGIAVSDTTAPDPDDKPLEVRIWYPASMDGAGAAGVTHPLVVISHGTGGSLMGHSDTAIALADAGYVVAAMSHTGDNSRDQSYVGKGRHLIGRSRHVSRVIDYMVEKWANHTQIDPARIGLFGHSAGGFTALVVAGGQPDMTHGAERCRKRPDAWDCQYLKKHGLDLEKAVPPPDDAWVHDARVKSAVIAAPAVGYAFEPDRLGDVTIPVQLWEAGKDDVVEDSPAIIGKLLPKGIAKHRVIPGAGHFSFLAPCTLGMRTIIAVMRLTGTPAVCNDPKGFDRAEFHQKFNRDVIAFFNGTLPESSKTLP